MALTSYINICITWTGFSNWLGIYSLGNRSTGRWCAGRLFYCPPVINQHMVKVEIFAQYIFSWILCRALDWLRFDVSENIILNIITRQKKLNGMQVKMPHRA